MISTLKLIVSHAVFVVTQIVLLSWIEKAEERFNIIGNMGTSNTNDTFCIRDNILIGSQTLNLDDTQNCINIGYLILTSFMSNPYFIGQVDAKTGEENTFYYMRKRSVRCALWMQDQGIQPNDVIMICTNNQLDAYVPFLAALYIGAVVSPLDQYFIEDNISSVLEQVKPAMLFIDEKFYMIALRSMNELKIPKGMPKTKIIVFSDKDENPSTKNKNLLTLEVVMNYSDLVRVELFSCVKMTNMKSTAMILFSSGTTASPVHIKIPHVAFMAPPDQHAPNMLKNDTALLFESLCFINGIFITIQAILLHVKVIRIESRFDAETACKIIEKYRVTWVFLETSMCLQLIKSCHLERHDLDVSSLKTVVFSGSAVNSSKVHVIFEALLPDASIIQAYSLTETGIIAYQRQSGKVGSSGYVSADVQLKFISLDQDQKLIKVRPNMRGEIYCTSPYMMIIHEAQELHLDELDNSIWFKTGDMGFYDEDGEIFVTGRINQLCEIKKQLFSPTLIENELHDHMAVFEAVAIYVSSHNDTYAIAFITKMLGVEVTEMELKQHVIQNCKYYNELRHVIFLPHLPRFSNGRINRKLLYNMARSNIFW